MTYRGLYSTEVAFLLLTQQPWALFSVFQKISFDVAEVYQWRWLEKSGLWLENDNPTHVILASGKLALQKIVTHF